VSLYNAVSATGSVKAYQTGQALVLLSFLPVTYVVLKFTSVNPVLPFMIQFVFCIISSAVSAVIALRQLQISVSDYLKHTVIPILSVLILSSILPLMLRVFLEDNFASFLIVCAVSVISVLLMSYVIGCNHNEREVIRTVISKRISILIAR
jgi:hypothetical protein